MITRKTSDRFLIALAIVAIVGAGVATVVVLGSWLAYSMEGL